MKKNIQTKVISLLLVVVILLTTGNTPINASASSKYIKASTFIKLVVQSLDLEVNNNDYINSALKHGILKEDDIKIYDKYITRTDVAVILNRADEFLHGNTIDSELLEKVLDKRISDINKISDGKRKSVALIYTKGIIKGYSNGNYVQNREFRGDKYITTTGAKNVINLVINPKKRAKISPDGHLIRTTNLPSNYKDYEYILECFPNTFYEHKFAYQRSKFYYKPVELEDYASPVKIKEITYSDEYYDTQDAIKRYKDDWITKIEKNLVTRLNVDYKTVDESWINSLANTYFVYNDVKADKRRLNDIKEYVNNMKKNKVVITSEIISVEPSTMYDTLGYYVIVYVKFKIKASNLSNISNVFYGSTDFIDLKNNSWHEGVYEISIGTLNGSSDGRDYAVINDSLNDYLFNYVK